MSLVVPFFCPSVVIRSRFSSRARVLPSFYVMCSATGARLQAEGYRRKATGGRLQAAIAQISEKEYHTQLRKAYPPAGLAPAGSICDRGNMLGQTALA